MQTIIGTIKNKTLLQESADYFSIEAVVAVALAAFGAHSVCLGRTYIGIGAFSAGAAVMLSRHVHAIYRSQESVPTTHLASPETNTTLTASNKWDQQAQICSHDIPSYTGLPVYIGEALVAQIPLNSKKYSPKAPDSETRKLSKQTYFALKAPRQLERKGPLVNAWEQVRQDVHKWGQEQTPIKQQASSYAVNTRPWEITEDGSFVSIIGIRPRMEDAHFTGKVTINTQNGDQELELFGICDGHGGAHAATLVAQNYLTKFAANCQREVVSDLTDRLITNALMETCIDMQEAMQRADNKIAEQRSKPTAKDGTTLLLVVKCEGKIYVANVGDSDVALCKPQANPYSAYFLTEPASLTNPRYVHTIWRARGEIKLSKDGTLRICSLNLTRDLGTTASGLIISARCKITHATKSAAADEPAKGIVHYQSGDVLIMACDGFWDFISLEEAYQVVAELKTQHYTDEQISRALIILAINNKTEDNVTVCVKTLS